MFMRLASCSLTILADQMRAVIYLVRYTMGHASLTHVNAPSMHSGLTAFQQPYCLRAILQRSSAAAAVGSEADSFRKGAAAPGGAQEVGKSRRFMNAPSSCSDF